MNKGMRELAAEAKKRLKGGYWKDYLEKRSDDVKRAERNGVDADYVLEAYKRKIEDRFKARKLPYENESDLYDKVYKIVTSNEIVINPLGQLIDKEYFDSLDQFEKQRYVFKLSEAYVSMRNRIMQEMKYEAVMKE